MGVVQGMPPPGYFPGYQPPNLPGAPPQPLLPPSPVPPQNLMAAMIPPTASRFPAAPFNPAGIVSLSFNITKVQKNVYQQPH